MTSQNATKASKFQTLLNAEEQHLAEMSLSKVQTKLKTTKKVSKKSMELKTAVTRLDNQETAINSYEHENKMSMPNDINTTKEYKYIEQKSKNEIKFKNNTPDIITKEYNLVASGEEKPLTTTKTYGENGTKKAKSKKCKKTDSNKQNISVKSSFSKFDALQKRNLIHNPLGEIEKNCKLCSKPVYKMEEIKAEKTIFHKNCFRCQECSKQLKLDNYQSHEGLLYCVAHYKILFVPKCVEDTEFDKPHKPELIIRESQPITLPPDVVRASDKPDLGLEELHQLNLRSKFQVFENNPLNKKGENNIQTGISSSGNIGNRSSSILTKLAKLQALGFAVNGGTDGAEINVDENLSSSDDLDEMDDTDDIELVRFKKSTQRERPIGLGHAMVDIKTKFENGPMVSREERREERKQEIQNIRSRLFMGKQARIKEMYQQAVAESEQGITSVGKKPEVDLCNTASTLKERFEKGDMYKSLHADDCLEGNRIQDEADVFESAISKKSRSIFMELDASVIADQNKINSTPPSKSHSNQKMVFNKNFSENELESFHLFKKRDVPDIVKYDEKPDDVQIETSEVSSKFKFFETYRPMECKKKEFRITPPREGVLKQSTSESDTKEYSNENAVDTNILGKSHTTSTMLNKFREMEQNKSNRYVNTGPRPLKCFTPPPDDGRRSYREEDSDLDSQDDEEEEEEDEDDNEHFEDEDDERYRFSKLHSNDEALKEVQSAARAKQLRAKFEKWAAHEAERELKEGHIDIYSEQVSDESTIESTKSIRERFENMKNTDKKTPTTPRYQVNRFV